MDSNVVNNNKILSSENALILIKSLFNSTFSPIYLAEIIDKGIFFYEVKYVYKDIEIWFGCEKGYVCSKISVNKQPHIMNKWIGFTDDMRLLNATEKNIYLLFNVAKETVNDIINNSKQKHIYP
jgi:hypothetical protein